MVLQRQRLRRGETYLNRRASVTAFTAHRGDAIWCWADDKISIKSIQHSSKYAALRQQMVRLADGHQCRECGDSFGPRSPGGAGRRQYLGPPWLTSDLAGHSEAFPREPAPEIGSSGARSARDRANNVISVETEPTAPTNNISP